ncbi:fasciclin domain-containing protein [Dyella soli]|uniref:FAS1 domain-containing protein n=1 Tax=Dyella soli TaxID=522319 RepID=A0A4R0YUG5_9GAMM|nr:fasciclin domain-containing protein [Dyella soli]TCI10152.1 hypothetical protein EZM97_14645 [Dyella soli]
MRGKIVRELGDGAAAPIHTLSKALEAAEFTNVLKGSDPYAVFAPTDAAFEKPPTGTPESWLKPENKAELISVRKCHVLPGRASSVEVQELTAPKMMGPDWADHEGR